MLTKITEPELLTTREARAKYRTKYFNMHITEVVDITCEHDKGYVMYTADNESELLVISQDEYKGKIIAHMFGDALPLEICLGVIYSPGLTTPSATALTSLN